MTSSSIYLLIFFAAFLHALWNIIIKSLKNSLVGMAMKVFFQSIIFFPVIFFVPLPVGITWLFLICSLILHTVYFILLGIMYNRSDLTFIYPIARGCAPFFVTILSLIFFVDHIPLLGILGILVISLGLIIISLENYKKNIDFKLISISLFIALMIAMYTFFDGAGVRSVGKSETYIVWNFFLGGWISIAYVYVTEKKELFELQLKEFFLILIASIISFSAYAIIMWSMKHEPIGFVASLRESSIIMASLIGYFILKEKVSYIRLISGVVFFVGVVLVYNS